MSYLYLISFQYMIELMEEYTFPKPMPEDVFNKYHVDVDPAYLMLSTAETGTGVLFKSLKAFLCNF